MNKYYYIYKITCTNGEYKDKFYFGQHTTFDLNDGYKGSGKLLHDYYKQYPNDYVKEIVCFCKDIDDLNQKEYEVIKPWLNNKMCLNLKHGGCGNELSEETKKYISERTKEAMKHVKLWNKGKHNVYSEETLKKISDAAKGNQNMKGKKHSDETKRKMSEKAKGRTPWNKGKKLSEDYKHKLSEVHKGIKPSEETRKKLSASLTGKPCPIKGKHRVYREDGTFYMQ